LDRISEAIAKLHVPSDLLAADESIRNLFEQKSAVQKSKQDCLRREAELSKMRLSLTQQVEQLRPGLTVEDAVGLEPGLLVRKRVQELAALAPRQEARLKSLKDSMAAAQNKVTQCDRELTQLPAISDTVALEGLAKQARRELDSARAEKLRIDIRAMQANVDIGLSSLTPWAGTSDELESLVLPAVEVIEEFRSGFQETAAAEKIASSKLADVDQKVAQTRSERDAIVAAHATPTFECLTEARSLREFGWTVVKSVWRDGNADAPEQHDFLTQSGQANLTAAYEVSTANADKIADRMRAEAERVERVASLGATIVDLEEQRKRADAVVAETATATEQLRSRWREAWLGVGIMPESPAAMLGWIRRGEGALQAIANLRQLRFQIESLEQVEATFTDALRAMLTQYGVVPAGRFIDLLEAAEAFVRTAREAAEKRQALNAVRQAQLQEVVRIKEELDEAHNNWSQWQDQWTEVLISMGLSPDTSPAATESYLNALHEIGVSQRTATDLQIRIEKMQADADAFAKAVSRLVSSLNPAISRLEPETAIGLLYQTLLSANEDRKLLAQEQKRQQSFESKLHDAVELVKRRTVELATLCREAGTDDVAAARVVWESSNRRRNLERALDEYNQRLVLVSAGKTIEEFLTDAQSVDFDSIAGRLGEIERCTTDHKEGRAKLEERRRSLDAEALAMQGGDEAAMVAQRISGQAGRLATDVEQYVRLKTAAFVLRRAIERYREENQGPVLEHAAKLFSALTCGSFVGLRVENVDGESVLVGLRPGPVTKTLTIQGMSDGTRDQLYLALRIASLEHYFAAHEAVPFIVDDVLLNFDDERARAALSALNGLSAQTQVIFFTHHRHLVELASSCTNAAMAEI
jgi:hypothetical protein